MEVIGDLLVFVVLVVVGLVGLGLLARTMHSEGPAKRPANVRRTVRN